MERPAVRRDLRHFQARMNDLGLNGNNRPRLLVQGLAKDFGANSARGWWLLARAGVAA